MGHWRDTARKHIAAAEKEARAQGIEGPALVKFVQTYYPFGPREHHPYKIWCDEIRRQFRGETRERPRNSSPPDPSQRGLFDREDSD